MQQRILPALSFSVLPLFVLLVCCQAANGQWTEFRGPNGVGRIVDAELPDAIQESAAVWKTPIPGKGWSSPVVWDDDIWITTAAPDGSTMSAICVSLTDGKLKHNLRLLENDRPDFCHPENSYASPTPVVTADRVFLHFGKYGTFCLDRETGAELWARKDFPCDHFRGPASSPILFDGKLYVAFDGVDQQYVVALNANNGETVWKKKREINYGTDVGDRMKGYGTASIIQVDQRQILVYPSAVATIAYDPADGTNLWTAYHDGMNASARPLRTDGGLVVITNGSGKMIAVRPDGTGDVSKTHIAWQLTRSVPKKASPVIMDGLLYMGDDRGVISCVEPETGESVWRKRVGVSYAASPVADRDKIYFFDKQENVHVIRPGREFNLISRSKLDDGCMASPAIAENQLVVRTRSHLYCFPGSNISGD